MRISGWACDNCRWDMISPGNYRVCPNCGELVRSTTLKEVKDRRMRVNQKKEDDA